MTAVSETLAQRIEETNLRVVGDHVLRWDAMTGEWVCTATGCDWHPFDDTRAYSAHVAAEQAAAIAPLLAGVRAGALEAAAVEIESWCIVGNDLLDAEIGRNIGYKDAATELRDRAAAERAGGAS